MFIEKKKFYKNKSFYLLCSLLIVISGLLYFLTNFLLIPNQINLIVGNEHKIQFKIPVVATLVNNDEAAIAVNSQTITKNTDINLGTPTYIKSQNLGTSDLKVKMFGVYVKNVKLATLPKTELIAGGKTVGVRINTDGIMVLGIGSVRGKDGKLYEPCVGFLRSGDLITKVDNTNIQTKEDLIGSIENTNNNKLNITINRKGEILSFDIDVIKGEDNTNKIGIWVRDSTQGIGTITYYNKSTNKYGALGHGITDVDTKDIMSVKDGYLMNTEVIGIKKGERGNPGELVGNINTKSKIGTVTKNTPNGIFGTLENSEILNKNSTEIGLRDEVKEGKATILSNINGTEIKEYDILIESVNKYNLDTSKSMIIKIVDEELLNSTGGIVQGMSGSPIIQNNKIIGAVTHVFVQEPSKGYGIFIENMLEIEG